MSTDSGNYTYLSHTGQQIDSTIDEVIAARGDKTSLSSALAAKADKTELEDKIEMGDVFGDGHVIGSEDDLDDYLDIGTYHGYSGSIAHSPTALDFRLEVVEMCANATMQRVFVADEAAESAWYMRIHKPGTGWGSWYKFQGTVVT